MLYRGIVAVLLAAAQGVTASFETEVQKILQRPAFENATIGIEVRRLKTGETVFSSDAYRSLVPASNQKLLTSALALRTLGADFRYNTTVLATAKPDNDGTLDGDIWLRGSGDPSLTSARLADLAQEIADSGVKKITGKVYGDGTRFDGKRLGTGWAWDDEPYYYSAQVHGLNCDGNLVNVTVSPGKAAGHVAKVQINDRDASKEDYVTVQSVAMTGSDEGISLDRERGTNTILISGSIPAGSDPVTNTITIEQPSAYAASRFALALKAAGVKVRTEPTRPRKTPDGVTKLAVSTSQPLADLLKFFMKPSDNMYGEALIKTVGYTQNPDQAGSVDSAVAAAQAFFDDAGIDYSGVYTVDGSGLSAMNTVTATFLCSLLTYIHDSFSKSDKAIYMTALPIGGVDGTLASRFVGTPLEGNIKAKTGSLSGVSSLSGYVRAKNNELYALSILMNHVLDTTEARGGQDDIAMALYSI
ncbi:hypothetical protein ACO1O0_004938 [Amphichorda felina]